MTKLTSFVLQKLFLFQKQYILTGKYPNHKEIIIIRQNVRIIHEFEDSVSSHEAVKSWEIFSEQTNIAYNN